MLRAHPRFDQRFFDANKESNIFVTISQAHLRSQREFLGLNPEHNSFHSKFCSEHLRSFDAIEAELGSTEPLQKLKKSTLFWAFPLSILHSNIITSNTPTHMYYIPITTIIRESTSALFQDGFENLF